MASIVGYVPRLVPGEGMPAWMKVDWSQKIEHGLYRDWGIYYDHRFRENLAMYYLEKAHKMGENDWDSLYRLSLARSKAAQIDQALLDAIKAEENVNREKGPSCPINLQICDALYRLNKFEKCAYTLHQNQRRFIGVKSKQFEERISVLNDTIADVCGKSLSAFYMKIYDLAGTVSRLIKEREIVDDRPLWKILKELGKCDVLSIPEIEEERLSPLEIARRKRAFNVIHQTYLNLSWRDVLFMKELRFNPSLLLDYCKRSKEFLRVLSHKRYDIVRRFIKMIHSRSPLYYISFLKFPDVKMLEKNKEANLFRIQYQTHRTMIRDLRHIRKLRKEKDVKRLSAYVEKIMGTYYVIKTHRVMCWRFQFYNEVYNTMALALAEQYYLPKPFRKAMATFDRLLMLPNNKLEDARPFVFGDRSTYQDGDDLDPAAVRSRRLISRLEKRIHFARCSIERCYLYHQIGDIHLGQLHYDECCFNARRAIKESHNCNSFIWRFLSLLLIMKANVLQNKVESVRESIEELDPVVTQLKSKELTRFTEVCLNLAHEQVRKRQTYLGSSRSMPTSSAATLETSSQLQSMSL